MTQQQAEAEATPHSFAVVLLEAKALPLLRSIHDGEFHDRSPSAYCEVSYKRQTFYSDVQEDTVNPQWNQQFDVALHDSHDATVDATANDEVIVFRVHSQTPWRDDKSSTLLGQVTVRLASLNASQSSTTLALPLGHISEDEHVVYDDDSELIVMFRHHLSSSQPQPARRTVTWRDLETAKEASKSVKPSGSSPASFNDPNYLVVTILEAQGLLSPPDTGGGISINPIVKLCFTKEDKSLYQHTRVAPKTLFPQWRQRFFFPFDRSSPSSSTAHLSVLVQDEGWIVSGFLGSCVIDVDAWVTTFGDRKKTLWLALASKDQANQTTADLTGDRRMSLGLGCICIAMERRYLSPTAETALEQGETDDETIVPAMLARRPSSMLIDHDRNINEEDTSSEATPPPSPGAAPSTPPISQSFAEGPRPLGRAEGDQENRRQAHLEQEEARRRSRQAQADALQQLSQVHFASGDYQIQLHVIQVRELKPMDLNGLCDPVVQAECLGRKQFTRIKRNTLTTVFDEFLFFEFHQIDAQLIQRASIRVTALDADAGRLASMHLLSPSRFSDFIGGFSIDAAFVYYQSNHEIKRQWVALVDGDGKLGGYLQLSVVVLGPNDTLPTAHLPSYLALDKPDQAPTSSDHLKPATSEEPVLLPPQLTRELLFLVVGIYELCELPHMNEDALLPHFGSLGGKLGALGGCMDAFVQVDFMSGQQRLQTRSFKLRDHQQSHSGEARRAPAVAIVNQELWFPIWLPSMSNSLVISVNESELTATEPIANCTTYTFEQVQKQPELGQPRWTNLYGPPLLSSIISSEEQQYMLQNPSHASTYRGRILLSLRVENAGKSVNQRAHVRNLHSDEYLSLPDDFDNSAVELKRYVLQARVFYGTELPQFTSGLHWTQSKTPLRVSLAIGRHSVYSRQAENYDGICHWNETLRLDDLIFPTDLDQVPDVFVYLSRAGVKESHNVCFARLPAKQVAEQEKASKPQWRQLQRDFVLEQAQDSDPSANLLLSVSLTPLQDDSTSADIIEQTISSRPVVGYYTLLVHVFQGKSLAPMDADGLMDPFLKIHCAGVTVLTTKRAHTRDPSFYESVSLQLALSEDADVPLPHVLIQLFDFDRWGTDDYAGSVTKSLDDVPRYDNAEDYLSQQNDDNERFATPKWYPVRWNDRLPASVDNCFGAGELLLSFELIRKTHKEEIISPPASIHPHRELKYLEIICLGVRDLKPMGFTPLQAPFVEFELSGSHAAAPTFASKHDKMTNSSSSPYSRVTAASSTPSPSNANFLERLVLPVKLPVNPIYAPRLSITVYDKWFGGFYKPLLGVATVDLNTDRVNNSLQKDQVVDVEANPHVERATDYSTCPIAAIATRKHNSTASSNVVDSPLPTEQDQGIGVLPALRRPELSLPIESPALEQDASTDEVPSYLQHRRVLSSSLEAIMMDRGSPFQTFTLFRGEVLTRQRKKAHVWDQASLQTNSFADAIHAVGCFKGLIRIIGADSVDEPCSHLDLTTFFTPQPFLVRVYVLDAERLMAKDTDNKSNPYLRLILGTSSGSKSTTSAVTASQMPEKHSDHLFLDVVSSDQVIDDRVHHKSQTLFPKFHKLFEFKTLLPGVSDLRIEVRHYDSFSLANSMHWFNGGDIDELIGATSIDLEDRWFSAQWQALGRDASAAADQRHEPRKPLELRPLFAPNSTIPQGSLRLWVDILTPFQMRQWPAWNVTLAAPELFEVRVIIYRAKHVLPGDVVTKLNDLYVKCWFQNDEHHAQCTDIHWRSAHGQACFNWRMKFDVALPIDRDLDGEHAKGYLQLQLWDRDIMFDDCLSEAVLDLTRFLNRAHSTNAPVNVFSKQRPHKRQSRAQLLTLATNTHEHRSSTGTGTPTAIAPPATPPAIAAEEVPHVRLVDDPKFASLPHRGSTASRSNSKDMIKHLQAKADAASLIRSFKERLGMVEEADDTTWLVCTTSDARTGARVRAGELLLSIEILPKQLANLRAAGFGRSEPNCFPFLPEPNGRLNLSAMWNPCYVVEALVGPDLYRSLSYCLLCFTLIGLCVLTAPLLNSAMILLSILPSPARWIVLCLSLAAICIAIAYGSHRIRHALATSSPNDAWDEV